MLSIPPLKLRTWHVKSKFRLTTVLRAAVAAAQLNTGGPVGEHITLRISQIKASAAAVQRHFAMQEYLGIVEPVFVEG